MKDWFQRVVLRRTWLCFIVMGWGFFTFGLGTLNLIYIARANVALLAEHGWQAMMDGGLLQLAEILLTGYASLAAYIVFKACEHTLALRLSEGH